MENVGGGKGGKGRVDGPLESEASVLGREKGVSTMAGCASTWLNVSEGGEKA